MAKCEHSRIATKSNISELPYIYQCKDSVFASVVIIFLYRDSSHRFQFSMSMWNTIFSSLYKSPPNVYTVYECILKLNKNLHRFLYVLLLNYDYF